LIRKLGTKRKKYVKIIKTGVPRKKIRETLEKGRKHSGMQEDQGNKDASPPRIKGSTLKPLSCDEAGVGGRRRRGFKGKK